MCNRWWGGSRGYKWAFYAQLYGSNRRLRTTSRTFGWHSPQLCDIAWPSTYVSCHSCRYGTVIGWCPYSRCASCISKRLGCYTSCNTKTGAIVDNTPACWWRRPGWRNAATKARQLKALMVESMSPCLFPWALCALTIINSALHRR